MENAVEMGSDAMMDMPSFIKIGSAIKKLMRLVFTDTQTAWRSHKPAFIFFFKMREIG
jgi:hypothetical protein